MSNLLNQIISDLVIDEDTVLNIINRSNKHYKRYKVPKKKGGERTIYHPSPSLKLLQYWLTRNIFSKLPVSEYALAYEGKTSIKKNATKHINSKHFLHMDIESFFESITKKHICDLFDNNQDKILFLNETDLEIICKIVLFNDHLVIGSVSSPVISNRVMFNFDLELREVLPKDILYTRYADDMIFSSTKFIDPSVTETVKDYVRKYGFNINNKKTYYMSKKGRRIVTGIIIDRGKLSIGTKRKKEIKSMIYKKLKHGKGKEEQILGYLFFLKDIEPDYFNKILKKYSNYGDILNIFKGMIDYKGDTVLSEVAVTKDED